MPLPNNNFYYVLNLQSCLVNPTTAEYLADGYIYFYRDIARSVLKPVYKLTNDGTNQFIEISNPVRTNATGQFVDGDGDIINLYLFPFENTPSDTETGQIDLYYIEMHDSDDVLINPTVPAWPPNVSQNNSDSTTFDSSDNQISNPQFSDILFNPTGTTYSVSGSNVITQIAPDWYVLTNGTGTFTVNQISITSTTIPTSPSYALQFTALSVTDCKIFQRFLNSPRLFANGFVSASITCASQDALQHNLQLDYIPSTGDSYPLVSITTTSDNQFNQFIGNAQIDGVINSDSPSSGYVDISLSIPVGALVQITSVQFLSAENQLSLIDYIQESESRYTDHSFHYYKPLLTSKSEHNALVGWDFPKNPAQFGESISTTTGSNFYVWDKTICFQSANSTVSFARSTDTLGLKSTMALSGQIALVQYIPAEIAREMLYKNQCVQLMGKSVGGAVTAQVNLYWTTDATVPTLPNSLIVSVGTDGTPTVGSGGANGTWTKVKNNQTNLTTIALSTAETVYNITGYDTYTTSASTTATFLAIVVSTATTSNGLDIRYINLVQGNSPCPPSQLTKLETLSLCQQEFYKTYNQGVAIGASTDTNSFFSRQQAVRNSSSPSDAGLRSFSFEINYPSQRDTPIITIYNPTSGASNNIKILGLKNGASPSLASGNNPSSISFSSNYNTIIGKNKTFCRATSNTTELAIFNELIQDVEVFVQCHFTADSRLGVV